MDEEGDGLLMFNPIPQIKVNWLFIYDDDIRIPPNFLYVNESSSVEYV